MTAETMRVGEMPTREGDLTIEGHGMEPIPENARYGSVSRVFTVWFTPNLVPAAFFIGTLVTLSFLQLGFWTSILAIIVGNVVGALFVALLSTMGPKLGLAQMPAARLPFGKSIVLPGLLNWLSTIGWDGINNVFGAIALTILIPALPFWAALLVIVVCQAALGIIGYEAIHTFEKWMAFVLGAMFVVLTISIFGQGQADTSAVDGMSGADLVGAFVGFVAIVASFVLAWCLYASDYSRYLPSGTNTGRVFWYTLLGLCLSAGWLEVLGVLVASQATGGESSDTIYAVLGGSGVHHRRVGHDRHLHRDHRGQRDERLHRLAVAAGSRSEDQAGVLRRRGGLPGVPLHPLPPVQRGLLVELLQLPAVHQLLDLALRRSGAGRLVAARPERRRVVDR